MAILSYLKITFPNIHRQPRRLDNVGIDDILKGDLGDQHDDVTGNIDTAVKSRARNPQLFPPSQERYIPGPELHVYIVPYSRDEVSVRYGHKTPSSSRTEPQLRTLRQSPTPTTLTRSNPCLSFSLCAENRSLQHVSGNFWWHGIGTRSPRRQNTGFGSVFLGDFQRQRILSTSTPPSSPPPDISPSTQHFSDIAIDTIDEMDTPAPSQPPPTIPPALSLDLRIRWLETLVYGTKQTTKAQDAQHVSLVRGVEDLQRKLDSIVHSSEGLRRFIDHYEQHAHLLTPSFALSGTVPTSPPQYENMSPSEVEAFLAEMEQDIRAADRDLREIEMLENKDVTAAGKLTDYEALQPRLEKLVKAHEEDLKLAAELEKRVAALMDRYATNVDTLSELFVAWDDSIQEAELEVGRLTRDIEERRRLGYE
ncbi:hypothetical protein BXZ70DRAFT_1005463 [Cristinia sonorae]|uniref:Uncharacterized protein n=1 Tax=Cristinia sonorae TaxID=1940300 RepID=A0A8K0XSH2_9AGAR|nr:hypothetical protein BXZ70DRAFT_1005463 [Cristinia sonorae]